MSSPLSFSLLRVAPLVLFFTLFIASASAALSGLPDLASITGSHQQTTTSAAQTTTSQNNKNTQSTSTDGSTLGGTGTGSSPAPTVSISAPATTTFKGLSDAPTIEGVGIPTLVVPDTSHAPYMQKSNLPEGTVFICVGAALAFLGLSVIAWRGLVAWSLHRSVRRAASSQYAPEKRPMYRNAGYPSLYNSENVSLEHLANTKTSYHGHGGSEKTATVRTGARPSSNMQRSSRNPTGSSLFFSPTAGAGAGLHSQSGRSSMFLPPGYYASGSAAPAAGAPVAHVGGGSYSRVESHPSSPPSTPGIRGVGSSRPQGRDRDSVGHERTGSNQQRPSARGSLGLGVPPTGRAPSAYLEDLFETHGNAMSERD